MLIEEEHVGLAQGHLRDAFMRGVTVSKSER